MAKKTIRKNARPKPSPAGSEGAYPAAPEALADQQQRVSQAAAAGAAALRPMTPALAQKPPEPAKPLTTLDALWPANAPAKQEPTPAAPPKAAPARSTTPLTTTPTPQQKPAAPPRAAAPEPPKTKPHATPGQAISFVLFEPKAKKVSLGGDFNNWAADLTPMKARGDGHWEATVSLAPGRYEYKFVVDGQWIPDPMATEQVWNRHGTLNSVKHVRS